MYQDCIYVGNSGKLIIWNYDFQTINECTLVQLMDDQHIYGGYWTDSGKYWHEMAVKKHELASAF